MGDVEKEGLSLEHSIPQASLDANVEGKRLGRHGDGKLILALERGLC